MRKPINFPGIQVKLKYYKAKIIQLHSNQLQNLQAELRENSTVPDEKLSFYHVITRHKRRKSNLITEITDKNGGRHTTQHISRTFYTELQARFKQIPTHTDSQEQIYTVITSTIGTGTQELMDRPITLQELQLAIAQAPRNKSPGADGITAEFYQWGIDILQNDLLQLYNDFFATVSTTHTHASGIINSLYTQK